MHILVFGGTGSIIHKFVGPSLSLKTPGACGKAFIPEALHAGHELTLYARNPSKFSREITGNSKVHIVEGEFTDTAALKKALDLEPELLVSFAGPTPPSKGMPITDFYERLCPLLPASSIHRCFVLSTASYKVAEDRWSLLLWLAVWMIYLFAGTAYQEINGLSRAIAALPSDKVEWTLFRVPILTNAETKPVRANHLGARTDRLFVSRKSIAVWILHEIKDRKWIGGAPNISNPGWL